MLWPKTLANVISRVYQLGRHGQGKSCFCVAWLYTLRASSPCLLSINTTRGRSNRIFQPALIFTTTLKPTGEQCVECYSPNTDIRAALLSRWPTLFVATHMYTPESLLSVEKMVSLPTVTCRQDKNVKPKETSRYSKGHFCGILWRTTAEASTQDCK